LEVGAEAVILLRQEHMTYAAVMAVAALAALIILLHPVRTQLVGILVGATGEEMRMAIPAAEVEEWGLEANLPVPGKVVPVVRVS
jgi:hypothetical protein